MNKIIRTDKVKPEKVDKADIVTGAWKDLKDKDKDDLLRKLAKKAGLWGAGKV